MSTIAIETHALSKQFGGGKKRVHAVQSLDLKVAAQQVYGFLGPNGAGKTTTIRMLLDLIRPASGEALLFGQSPRKMPDILRRVGALVEGATFYPYLSGRENLEVLARTGGYYDAKRIQQLIELVGMADRADRPAGKYSTGMKQRMGLAAALLSNPDLVILDEPTNGLDPAGIQEMRHFIRELVEKDGKTVFLSSHMLSEVEQICDRVTIINRGRIVREGAVAELLAENTRLRVDAEPLDKARTVIADHWQIAANGSALLIDAQRDDIPVIVRKLVEQQVNVYEITPQRQSLEEYFLAATQEGG
ncbi:MAG: ABC transporter ATP-binding protein [Chloroflexota bacterium]|nr:ABC transporter ATP-binding protein [Chloroflexota bacterium]